MTGLVGSSETGLPDSISVSVIEGYRRNNLTFILLMHRRARYLR